MVPETEYRRPSEGRDKFCLCASLAWHGGESWRALESALRKRGLCLCRYGAEGTIRRDFASCIIFFDINPSGIGLKTDRGCGAGLWVAGDVSGGVGRGVLRLLHLSFKRQAELRWAECRVG